MKQLQLAGFAVLLLSTHAGAGVVAFSPSSNVIALGESFTVGVVIESSISGSVDAFNIHVGSNGGGVTFDDFTFGDYTRFFDNSSPDTEFYDPGWRLGAFGLAHTAPLLVGTLSMTMVDLGPYEIVVDSNVDGGRSYVGSHESLMGSVVVHGVPEPGTLSLLGLAALGLIRNRRHARGSLGAVKRTRRSG